MKISTCRNWTIFLPVRVPKIFDAPVYKGMMLPLAVLAGLTVLVRRNTKNDHHDEETIMSHDPKPLGDEIISKPVMIFLDR